MRVLLVSWEYPPVIEGGLGRHVRKLSEQLAARGDVEVHVLTRGGGRLPQDERRRGVRIHRVTEPPFPHEAHAFVHWVRKLNDDMRGAGAQLLERFEFELVHSHDWLVSDAAEQLARAAGLPWLVTIHATEYGRHQGYVQRYPQSYIHAVERGMAARADHVITCSQYMAGHVARIFGVPAQKLTTIPNGVDPAELRAAPPATLAKLRLRYAAPDQQLVLMVGRLVFEKGFHLALDALAPITHRKRNVRFVIAGSGSAEAQLKAQARTLGLAGYGSFIGWAGDDLLHSLYRISDLCIVPSIYEPFGLVALEAMASGCLCVVADTGGLREVVPPGDTVGLRFRSSDADALREILERALSDRQVRERMVAQARRYVLRFDWAEVARRTHGVYTRMLRAKRAPDPARSRACQSLAPGCALRVAGRPRPRLD